MTTNLTQTELVKMQSQVHADCVVCSPSNERGLKLKFVLSDDGSVEASFDCNKAYEGYAGNLHGGVISALLDGAMTHCIFACGHAGVTAELKVRYRHPVVTEHTAIVRGWVKRYSRPLYLMAAELLQDGQVKVTATAKFMIQPQLMQKG